jgi:hypothetical protein
VTVATRLPLDLKFGRRFGRIKTCVDSSLDSASQSTWRTARHRTNGNLSERLNDLHPNSITRCAGSFNLRLRASFQSLLCIMIRAEGLRIEVVVSHSVLAHIATPIRYGATPATEVIEAAAAPLGIVLLIVGDPNVPALEGGLIGSFTDGTTTTNDGGRIMTLKGSSPSSG